MWEILRMVVAKQTGSARVKLIGGLGGPNLSLIMVGQGRERLLQLKMVEKGLGGVARLVLASWALE